MKTIMYALTNTNRLWSFNTTNYFEIDSLASNKLLQRSHSVWYFKNKLDMDNFTPENKQKIMINWLGKLQTKVQRLVEL